MGQSVLIGTRKTINKINAVKLCCIINIVNNKGGFGMKNLDKYRGCLIGGAVGDALGYAVEFDTIEMIYEKYGEHGITEYEINDGVANISDDTQMSLFTANGLLIGKTRGMMRGIRASDADYILYCYEDWLLTQTEKYPLNIDKPKSWLLNVPELFNRRAPGITCLEALKLSSKGIASSIENPTNNSKGCGGLMRVAPIGIYYSNERVTNKTVDMIGVEVSALTHGHELGYIPSATLVHIIRLVSHSDSIRLIDAINDALKTTKELFSGYKHIDEFIEIINKAINFALSDMNDILAITQLGGGWVAEETLAISIYCCLKYEYDFEKAIIASVNHSGDSDSTGSVTGNILGAYLGIKAIPQKYLDNLELYDVIIEIADDLFNDCQISEYSSYKDEIWIRKY